MFKYMVMASMVLGFSFQAFSAETGNKSVKRKIASAEIKCAANPNEGIGIDPEYIEKQVKEAKSCYEASNIVESCGAGSSMDSMTTSAAISLCDKLTGKLSKADANLKKLMGDRCSKVCNPQTDGTMCISQQAFCRLDVSKFLNSVNSQMN